MLSARLCRLFGALLPLCCIVACQALGAQDESGGATSVISQKVEIGSNPKRLAGGRKALAELTHVVDQHLGLGAAGTIPGKGGVNHSTGAYEYTLDLSPIPGPDRTPLLGLAYSSNQGNGPVGVGWSISGLSSITRCGHNIAQDGVAGGFDFNDDHTLALNQYCLDGVKLVPQLRDGNDVIYRVEANATERIRAVFQGQSRDPAYFKIDEPNGYSRLYGVVQPVPELQQSECGAEACTNEPDVIPFDTNSQANSAPPAGWAADHPPAGSSPAPYAWHLSHVIPPGGNNLTTYRYLSDPGSDYRKDNSGPGDGDTRYLASVQYGTRSIKLQWEDRPDPIIKFGFGYDLSVQKRLRAIELYGNPQLESPALVYTLDYTVSPFTQRSELQSVRLTDRLNSSLQPTTFEWAAPPVEPGRQAWGGPEDYEITTVPWPSEFHQYNPYGYLSESDQARLLVGDINGDGFDDAVFKAGTDKLGIYWGASSGFKPTAYTTQALSLSDFSLQRLVDFDGDGRAEVVIAKPDCSQYSADCYAGSYAALNWNNTALAFLSGDTPLAAILTSAPFEYDLEFADPTHPHDPTAAKLNNLTIADFNGDGIPDLSIDKIRNRTTGVDPRYPDRRAATIFLGKGKFDYQPPFYNNPFYANGGPTVTADFNGDGRSETLQADERIGNTLELLDVNGDGIMDWNEAGYREDVCGVAVKDLRLNIAYGRDGLAEWWPIIDNLPVGTFAPLKSRQLSYRVQSGSQSIASVPGVKCGGEWKYDERASRRHADFNGDGLTDILFLNPLGGPLDQTDVVVSSNDKSFAWYAREPVLLLATPRAASVDGRPIGYEQVRLPLAGWRLRGLWTPPSSQTSSLTNPSFDWNFTAVGDVNGDGLTDVVQVTDAGLELIKLRRAADAGPRRDVIVSVTNGVEQQGGSRLREQIRYANLPELTEQGRYVPFDGAACLPSTSGVTTTCMLKGLVVSEYKPAERLDSRNLDGSLQFGIQYSYTKGSMQPAGRGFLGFSTFTWLDNLTKDREVFQQTIACSPKTQNNDFGLSDYATAFHGHIFGYEWLGGAPSPNIGLACYPTTSVHDQFHHSINVPGVLDHDYATRTTTKYEYIEHVPIGVSNDARVLADGAYWFRPTSIEDRDHYADFGPNTAGITQMDEGVLKYPVIRRLRAVYTYDEFNNITAINRSTLSSSNLIHERGVASIESRTFNNDCTKWQIGNPLSVSFKNSVDPVTVFKWTETRSSTYSYDKFGRLQTETAWSVDPNQRLQRTIAYTNGLISSVTTQGRNSFGRAETRVVSFDRSADGLPIHIRVNGGDGVITNVQEDVTTIDYDSYLGVPISVVGANGVGTDFVYDGFGRRVGTFTDDGAATFEQRGVLERSSVPDSWGIQNETWISAPCDAASQRFAGSSRCFAARGASEIAYRYQQSNNYGFDGTAETTTQNFDALGRLVHRTVPQNGPDSGTTFSYDGFSRLLGVVLPDGGRRQYDYVGRFQTNVKKFDRTGVQVGGVVTYYKDLNDLLSRVTETLLTENGTTKTITTYLSHDPFQALAVATRDNGSGETDVSKYSYDDRGRMISSSDATRGTRTFKYDAFGELIEIDNADGTYTTYRYDARGRPIIEDGYAAGRPPPTNFPTSESKFIWDTAANGFGKLASASYQRDYNIPGSKDIITRSFEYDQLGRNTKRSSTALSGFELSLQYDDQGRVWRTTYPSVDGLPESALVAENHYNVRGYLESVQLTSAGLATELWRQLSLSPRLSVESSGDGLETSRVYDTRGRATGLVERRASDRNVILAAVSDYVGRDTVQTRTIVNGPDDPSGLQYVAERYGYDSLGRLTSWQHGGTAAGASSAVTTSEQYGYDDFGPLTSITRAVDGSTTTQTFTLGGVAGGTGRILTSAPAGVYTDARACSDSSACLAGESCIGEICQQPMTYDGAGRQTSRGGSSITYNAWDLPEEVGTTSYRYDALHHRARRWDSQNSSDSTYYLDDDVDYQKGSIPLLNRIVAHVRANGRLVADVVQTFQKITPTFSHGDDSNTVLLRSEDAADYTRLDYSAFGGEIASDGTPVSASMSDFATGFQGQHVDGDDLIKMGGREYDARAHRFLTPDRVLPNPFGSQGYNPYAFAMNDPINNQDPSGFECTGSNCDQPVPFCLGICFDTPSGGGHRGEPDDEYHEQSDIKPPPYSAPPSPGTPPPQVKLTSSGNLESSNGIAVALTQTATRGIPFENDSWAIPPLVSHLTWQPGDIGPPPPPPPDWVSAPHGWEAPPVPNGILGDPGFKGDPDAAEFWRKAFEIQFAVISMVVGPVASLGDAAEGAGAVSKLGDESYEVLDGVRRAKAAAELGQETIAAEVQIGGRTVASGQVPVSSLLSPNKSVIDVSTQSAMQRWLNVLNGTHAGDSLPPIIIQPGARGVPISGVGFRF